MMTEAFALQEEIEELEAQIVRLKASMQKADNGVKLYRLRVISRALERLKDLAKGEAA